MITAEYGHARSVELLLQYGANVNHQDKLAAIHYAIFGESSAQQNKDEKNVNNIVILYLQYHQMIQTKFNMYTRRRWTPLFQAVGGSRKI